MDSGNSSSMQSSSGGADPPPDHQEYDSTPTPLHFDFNTTTTPPPPPPHHHQHMPPHLLIPQPPPPNLAAGDHLQQTPTTTTSAFIHPHMMMNINNPTNVFLQQPFSHSFTTSTTSWTSTTSPSAPTSSIDPGLLDPTYISFHPPPPSSSSILPPNTTSRPPKNPRKRSRASRRAPTTVLATDTSNFRAMVQEFTGIPAPHPPPSSSPYSSLLSSSFNSRPPSPHTPIFPDPFFSFLQHPHQHQLPAPAGTQGYMQQLPFTNPPFGPTHHHIPRDIAIDPPPVVDCIHDRGVNQVITSTSSCGASTDFLAQQGDNAEQGNQHE